MQLLVGTTKDLLLSLNLSTDTKDSILEVLPLEVSSWLCSGSFASCMNSSPLKRKKKKDAWLAGRNSVTVAASSASLTFSTASTLVLTLSSISLETTTVNLPGKSWDSGLRNPSLLLLSHS